MNPGPLSSSDAGVPVVPNLIGTKPTLRTVTSNPPPPSTVHRTFNGDDRSLRMQAWKDTCPFLGTIKSGEAADPGWEVRNTRLSEVSNHNLMLAPGLPSRSTTTGLFGMSFLVSAHAQTINIAIIIKLKTKTPRCIAYLMPFCRHCLEVCRPTASAAALSYTIFPPSCFTPRPSTSS